MGLKIKKRNVLQRVPWKITLINIENPSERGKISGFLRVNDILE